MVFVDDQHLATRHALFKVARQRRAVGHEWVQLVAVRKRKPDAGRIRIFPGTHEPLYGRVVGETGKNHYLIDVRLDDIERAMAKEGADT